MTLKLYGLKNCDTCRKALKELGSASVTVVFHDIREDGPDEKQLARWLAIIGRDRLLNTRSTTWRSLNEAERLVETDAMIIALLKKHPALIKRPVIETATGVSCGWGKAELEKLTNI